jgi:hypothetical protein
MPSNERSGCLFAIFKLFAPSGAAPEVLPYRCKDYLLSRAERSFFGVLQQAVGRDFLIFAKVRVADLVWMPKGTQSRQAHFNRIQSKHIDFLLCSCDVIKPVLAIELDDSSHATEARQSRDAFVDEARSYNVKQLRAMINAAVSSAGASDRRAGPEAW